MEAFGSKDYKLNGQSSKPPGMVMEIEMKPLGQERQGLDWYPFINSWITCIIICDLIVYHAT